MPTSDLLASIHTPSLDIGRFGDLSAFELTSLHWDERDGAITAAFEGSLDDAGRLAMHAAPDHDRVAFHLRFPNVTDFEVQGWSHEPASRFECLRGDDTKLTVTITGPSTSVRFSSSSVVVVDRRTSHAAAL